MTKHVYRTLAVLFCVTLLSFSMIGRISARFTSEDAANDQARVGSWNISVEEIEKNAPLVIYDADGAHSATYKLKVSNKSETDAVCDLKIQFVSGNNVIALPENITVTAKCNNTVKEVKTSTDRKSFTIDTIPVDMSSDNTYEVTLTGTTGAWVTSTEDMTMQVEVITTQAD